MITPPFGVPRGTRVEAVEAALKADVEMRLKNVCAHWSDEDFRKLVDEVTRTAMKYIPQFSNRE